ncbi:MAG: hypothetical protein R3B57_00280 [Phycisphaerales bacterium]
MGLIDTFTGLCRLAVMVARTRGVRGAYWSWRTSTAFADRPPRSLSERLRALVELARWMSRTRRLGS